jgi:exodeoxyribonuclease V alpha subunit
MLILVGDAGQLPSVGPGNVLADLIRSEKVPVYYLTDMFRQEKEGLIAVNAHRVRQGKLPLTPEGGGEEPAEYVYVEHDHSQQVLDEMISWCRQKIPSRYGLDPVGDTQVLTPMHKGLVGTVHLNQVLQSVLNPDAEGITLAGQSFKMGDKVMHLVNNYRKEVFNGDIGVICDIEPDKNVIGVDYEGRRVPYEAAEVHELSSAYAISIHKSQGSEYPAVIIPLVTQHHALLQRNVLYTALTRARRLVVLIGSRRAVAMAVGRDQPSRRLTWLAERLREQGR